MRRMNLRFVCIQALLFWAATTVQSAALQCKDGANADISWGIYYIVPGTQNARAIYAAGAPAWEANPVNLADANGVLGGLLTPFYTPATKTTYNVIAYSNFPPYFGQALANLSPAKGVMGYTDGDGWWLVHSVGKWPNMQAAAFEAPPAGDAGLIVCVSLPFASMREWATVLKYESPLLYYYHSSTPPAPTSLGSIKELSDLTKTSTEHYVPPFAKSMTFTTVGANGVQATLLTKLSKAYIDIYSRFMNMKLNQSLLVWSDQGTVAKTKLPSYCSGLYKVENVKPGTITVDGAAITRLQDKANWAVSKTADANAVFCISDSVRKDDTKSKPGGAVCLRQQQLQTLFSAIANTAGIEECRSNG